MLILYGTEYGFSEEVVKKLFDKLAEGETYQELSLQPRVVNSKDFELIDFTNEQVILCVFSTTGDGEQEIVILINYLLRIMISNCHIILRLSHLYCVLTIILAPFIVPIPRCASNRLTAIL